MNRLLTLILLLLSFSIVTGCSQDSAKSSNENIKIFDPGVPGTDLGDNVTVRPLINLQACPNINVDNCPEETEDDFGQVTLTWSVPNLYQTEEYVVVIFRIEKDGPFDSESTLTSLESPQSNLGVVPFEIARVKDTTYIDTEIKEGTSYYYWGFVILEGYLEPTPLTGEQVEGFWSPSSKVEVLTPSDGVTNAEPSPQNFWEKVIRNYGSAAVAGSGIANLRTLNPGNSNNYFPKGRLTTDTAGSVIFVSDTDNNRVIIWENANLRNCLQTLLATEEAEDPEVRDIYIYNCYLQSGGVGSSVNAYNVLGQPSQYTTFSCQEHNTECLNFLSEESCLADHNLGFGEYPSFCRWDSSVDKCKVRGDKCLTQPTEILYNKGELLISDTGNNRVLLYSDILFSPGQSTDDLDKKIIGCDPEVIPGLPSPTKCKAQKFFGKRSFDDFDTYSLSSGEAALNTPTGLLVDGDDLYIADTLNNRIVKVTNYYGTTEGDGSDINDYYECNDSSWLTAKCRWSGIMGQENYSQKLCLEDIYNGDNNILTGTFSNIVTDPNLLKRYFRYPTKMQTVSKENGDTVLLVSSNENFNATSDLGTQVALKGRILIFDGIPLKGSSPDCSSISFSTGGCDAVDVIGQEDFDKLMILSGSAGGAGDYKNIVYGLESINDFDFKGNSLYAVDNINNNIYVWRDIFNKTTAGFPYSFKVSDPNGEYNETVGKNLPNLKGLTGISYSETGDMLYIFDGDKGTFYQLNFLDFSNF